MNKILSPQQEAIIQEELLLLREIQAELAQQMNLNPQRKNYDQELLDLRDQLAESRSEDQAMLVEHMMRLSALRQAQDRELALVADPKNPYFAHLRLEDQREGSKRIRDIFIGKRAFIDSVRGIHVVDWRNSPISRIFYLYREGDEYEERFAKQLQTGKLLIRRTLSVHEGLLHRVRTDDELLLRDQEGRWFADSPSRSRLSGGMGSALRAPSEYHEDQRLPEITALIDPDQFQAITADRSGIVIIRGGAGTGKTTIALHRAAFLHFRDRKRYSPKRMLIITPGDALRRYVARVLPALDVQGVPIKTFEQWAHNTLRRVLPQLRKRRLTDETPTGARRLKRHPALLSILEERVKEEGRGLDEFFEQAGGPKLLEAWVRRRNLPIAQRISGLSRWLDTQSSGALGTKQLMARRAILQAQEELEDPFETWAELLTDWDYMGEGLRSRGVEFYDWELNQLVDTVSQQFDDPFDASDLDASHRQGVDGRALDDGEISGHLDVDDLAILLRICQLKFGRLLPKKGGPITFEHLVVDEAQDLSPLSLKLLCDMVRPGGPITLAGDTAQRIVLDNGFADWSELVSALNLKANILPPLAVSYRSTRQVMSLARHVLGNLAQEGAPRDARDGAPVELMRFEELGEAIIFLADALDSLRSREPRATVCLLARSPEQADLFWTGLQRAEINGLRRIRYQEFDFSPGIDLTDVYQVKGLEYDYVVILDATAAGYPDSIEARHLLHVAATRAAHQLWLIAAERPSPLLPDLESSQ